MKQKNQNFPVWKHLLETLVEDTRLDAQERNAVRLFLDGITSEWQGTPPSGDGDVIRIVTRLVTIPARKRGLLAFLRRGTAWAA